MLGVWLAGGALAFAGAMAYAELAAVRPHAGGEYVYLRDAYGPLAAFLTGWTSFVAGFSGAIAASAVALADYVGRFIPMPPTRRDSRVVVDRRRSRVADRSIHVRGLGPGRLVQNMLAGVKVSGDRRADRARVRDRPRRRRAPGRRRRRSVPVSWLLALVPVMFSYSGWNAAAYVAEEVRDPGAQRAARARRSAPSTVVIIYVALNALYVYALPIAELAALPGGRLMDTVAERLFGFAAGNLIALFTIVSIAASISAMVLAGPRVYFAMARDGMFVRARRPRPPALPHAGDRHRRAGRLEQRARAVGHAGAARELHGIRRRAVLRRRGQRAVRAAPPRRRRAAPVLRARAIRGRPRIFVARQRWRWWRTRSGAIRLVAGRRRAHRRGRAGVLR